MIASAFTARRNNTSKQAQIAGCRCSPELGPYLEEAFDLAKEGAVHVINRYRDTNQNLRTQLRRIIKRAGLEPCPKLFVKLRPSRETELAAEFPIHVVTAWLGYQH